MRSGGPAFLAYRRDELAAHDALAHGHVDPRQVQIEADQPLAMVDHDQAALVVQAGLGKGHDAPRRSDHRGPDRGSEIVAVVGLLGLAVQHALTAEPGGEARPFDRQDEAAREAGPVHMAGEPHGLALSLGGDAGQQHRVTGRHLVFGQAVDALDVEDARRDLEAAVGFAGRGLHAQVDAGGRVAIEADDEQSVRRRRAGRLSVDEDLGPGFGAPDGVARLDQPTFELKRRRAGQRRGG